MRTVVFGAEGPVGQWLVPQLSADPVIDHVITAPPTSSRPHQSAGAAPEGHDSHHELMALLEGADAVVWLPGTGGLTMPVGAAEELERVLAAVVESRALHVVAASSIAAYSPGAHGVVDEDWPTAGTAGVASSATAVAVERCLDRFEMAHEPRRVVRLRFAAVPDLRPRGDGAGSDRALQWLAAHPRLAAALWPRGLALQVLHPEDAATAVHGALRAGVRGPYNVAAEPAITERVVAQAWGGRPPPVAAGVARPLLEVTRAFGVQPVGATGLDLVLGLPTVAVARARQLLGWAPRHAAMDVVEELRAALLADPQTPTGTGARVRGPGTWLSPTANG